MPKIVTNFDLLLNWKKQNKMYKLVHNFPIDLPDEVINYLKLSYPDKQIKLVEEPQIPIVTKTNEPTIDANNPLNDLVSASTPNIVNSSINSDPVKVTIEKALAKGIITQKGVWYEFEGENICRGISKLKEKLETDFALLNRIHNKL